MAQILIGSLIFLPIGFLVGSFGIIQVLTILFFSIPMSIRFFRQGMLNTTTPLVRDVLSMLIISAIAIGASLAVIKFFPTYLLFYWVGMAGTVVLGIGQIGKNQNNISDYMQNNAQYLSKSYLLEATSKPDDTQASEVLPEGSD